MIVATVIIAVSQRPAERQKQHVNNDAFVYFMKSFLLSSRRHVSILVQKKERSGTVSCIPIKNIRTILKVLI